MLKSMNKHCRMAVCNSFLNKRLFVDGIDVVTVHDEYLNGCIFGLS